MVRHSIMIKTGHERASGVLIIFILNTILSSTFMLHAFLPMYALFHKIKNNRWNIILSNKT